MIEQVQVVNSVDLEWFNDLIKQAEACQAEANALHGAAVNKITSKYQLVQGDAFNPATGVITRVSAGLQLVKETDAVNPENSNSESETAQS